MKTTLSLFQVIILAIFGLFAIFGMIYFARGTYGSDANRIGEVLIWGTLDARAFAATIRTLGEDDERLLHVAYEEHDARKFDSDLAEAIASGKGPDLFILEHEYIMKDQPKIIPFPLAAVSERKFLDTFVDGTELFWSKEGALGIPVATDPLVLYFNRDMLATAGFADAPKSWNEVFDIAEEVTRKSESGNIIKSAIGLGEFDNVTHAKEILAALIMQAGSPITTRDIEGRVRPALGANAATVQQPTQSALRFYTEFSNPAKSVYSWNRALPSSQTFFADGNTALYVGFASELPLIRARNPNLNFAVTMLPQIQETARAVTFARMYAFSIPRGSLNPNGAVTAALVLAGTEPSRIMAQARGTPSPRRDVLSEPADGIEGVFRDSAIIGKGWLDPDPARSADIFRGMIEGAISGASRLSEAAQRGDRELTNLLGL